MINTIKIGKKNGLLSVNPTSTKEKKFLVLNRMIETNILKIKIAIPNSEEVYGSFGEKIGIFHDENDDMVAFTGTSNETFDPRNRNFESIDVFTSWNDKSRVDVKTNDFENLWQNKTKNISVYAVYIHVYVCIFPIGPGAVLGGKQCSFHRAAVGYYQTH